MAARHLVALFAASSLALAGSVAYLLANRAPLAPETIAAIRARVAARQGEVGYGGSLVDWIAASGGPC